MVFTPPSSPSSPSGPSGPGRFQRPNRFQPQNKDEHRINERIRVPQVRLIDEKGNQVGVIDTRDALKMAKERGLDLMEVSPNANPPVCKITDYGKFKYEKKKKEHVAKKKQSVIKVKEMQLRPMIDTHDLDYKRKAIRGFLEGGDKVKITIIFRGREVAHSENGYKILKQLAEELKELAMIEAPAKLEGKRMIMILAPAPGAKKCRLRKNLKSRPQTIKPRVKVR